MGRRVSPDWQLIEHKSLTAQLQDKVAIVTGGGGGIGKRIAREFAKAGADVVVASRSLAKLEPIAQEVRDIGRK